MDLICKFDLKVESPSKQYKLGSFTYVDLIMSSPSFAKSVKHAKEKWPQDAKEEHKRTTDKSREFELCNTLTMQKCD